jgi:hypothetical protein
MIPKAAGVDVDTVAVTAINDLGIASDQFYPGAARSRSHAACDCRQAIERHPFFQDEPGAQEERLRAAHGDVVDGAVHCQFPDVAAGKEKWSHHERIRRICQAHPADRDQRCVSHIDCARLCKRWKKQVFDQFRREFAAAAMPHDDVRVIA